MWTWPDGTVFYKDGAAQLFANWSTDEPNNHDGHENCLEGDLEGNWNDIDCGALNRPVCEKY